MQSGRASNHIPTAVFPSLRCERDCIIGRRQFLGELRVAGVLRGLQNRCRSVPQSEVGSIPTLSANQGTRIGGNVRPKWRKFSRLCRCKASSELNYSASIPFRIFGKY